MYDHVFQIFLENLEFQNLEKQNLKRYGFSVSYEFNQKYVFILGGKKLHGHDYDWYLDNMKKTCMKFNLITRKWENMPDLNFPRYGCGSYISQDSKTLWVFGKMS